MIDYPYPDLFLTEGTQKDYLITDGTVTVTGTTYTVSGETVLIDNSILDQEAFELYQSLNSEMQLTFGLCDTASIRFTVHKNDNSNITGTVLTVYLIPNHDASKMLQIGIFKVASDERSQDHKQHTITAYDAMYDILNADVSTWYNTILPDDNTTVTVAQFRTSFMSNFGVTEEAATLVNDDKYLRRTLKVVKDDGTLDAVSGADIIKFICQINGVFGTITNLGEFRYVSLVDPISSSLLTTDIPVSYCLEVNQGETFYPFKKVIVKTPKSTAAKAWAWVGNKNIFTVTNNVLISDYSAVELGSLTDDLFSAIDGHEYTPFTLTAIGNPLHEVGDPIKVFLPDGTYFYSYILERRMTGIQSLRDTYSANSDGVWVENLNSISDRVQSVETTERSGGGAISNDFVEVIRNIGFRLLDEPSDVAINYDDDTNTIRLNWSDPPDISTNEPVPVDWKGTVVVRKENSAPRHRWDGTVITDSNTRDEHKVNPLVDSSITYQKKYYYGIFPYDTKGDYRFTRVVSLEGQSVNRKVVVIDATGGSITNTIGNVPAIVVEGQAPSYDSVSGSSYFGSDKCLWKYSNGIVTRQELQNCRVIYVEIEAKMTTESIGALANIAFQLRKKDDDGALHKLIQVVAGNGNALSYALPLVRFNNYVDNTVALCPLYTRQNEFHKLTVEIRIDNLVAKNVVAYLDGAPYANEDLNVTLDAQFDEYMFYFETMDYSYLRSITMRME